MQYVSIVYSEERSQLLLDERTAVSKMRAVNYLSIKHYLERSALREVKRVDSMVLCSL